MSRRTLLLLIFGFILSGNLAEAKLPRISAKDFPTLIQRLSEQPGFFDSDNLVSNESSYLQILGMLDKLAVRGGVYLGVGPEQNFTYIARTRPPDKIMVRLQTYKLVIANRITNVY